MGETSIPANLISLVVSRAARERKNGKAALAGWQALRLPPRFLPVVRLTAAMRAIA